MVIYVWVAVRASTELELSGESQSLYDRQDQPRLDSLLPIF